MGKNQSASNLTNIIKQDASGNITFVSGSTTLMSVSSSGAITTTGNVAGTASYASNAELLDGLDSTVFTLTSSFAAQTASFTAFTSSVNTFTASQNITNGTFTLTSSFAAQTASFTAFTSSVNSFTASQLVLNGTYATTGSNTFAGIQTINSNLVVTGSITAQTLVVQTITSSVDFVTGSTRFGSIAANTHVFTGSVLVSGSATFSNNVFVKADDRGYSVQSSDGTYNGGLGNLNGSFLKTGLLYLSQNGTETIHLVATGSSYFNGGNVGIGTSSPDNKLHIISDAAASTNNYALRLQNTTTVADARVGIAFLDNSNTGSSASGATIQVSNNGVDGTGNLLFGTLLNGTNTERMRITSGGVVQITNAGDAQLKIAASGSSAYVSFTNSAGDLWGIGNSFAGATTNFELYNFTAAAYGFKIPRSGIYATTATSPRSVYIQSDGTLGGISSILASKTNIKQFNTNWLYDLKPVQFNYRKKDENEEFTDEFNTELFYGLIAEETELVNKEICTYNEDKLIGIEYSKLIPVLVKAIQELKAENDTLKERLTAGGL